MTSRETILVTGAAGGVGSTARVALGILLERGRRVRAMVRKLDGRSDALRELGAEVVVADMLDIVAVRTAMQGCNAVYFTRSISADYLEAAANVAVTAKSLGVKTFVNMSQMTVSQMSETETTDSPHQIRCLRSFRRTRIGAGRSAKPSRGLCAQKRAKPARLPSIGTWIRTSFGFPSTVVLVSTPRCTMRYARRFVTPFRRRLAA